MNTRFRHVGIALALVSLAALAGALAWTVARSPSVRIYLPSGWGLAPAGDPTPVGDMLAGGEASPDGRWIAFASVGQGTHRVYVVDRASGDLVDKVDIGRGWIGMGWSTDSGTLWVSGGTSARIVRLGVGTDGHLSAPSSVTIPGIGRDEGWLAGLAIDGNMGFIAVSASDRLVKIDLAGGRLVGSVDFEPEASPYQVRAAPDGLLYVSLQGAAEVAAVDPVSMRVVATIPTGRHPNDVLVSGDRLFVACGNDDVVDVFDLHTRTREERVVVRPWPDAPPGSTPHALAISPDGERLYVALSDDNAVAVLDVARRGRTEILGFIPTAAYPSAVATLADDRRVLVGSGKGFGTGANDETEAIDPLAPQGYPYIVTLMNGILYRVDASDSGRLEEMTRTVLEVSRYKPDVIDRPLRAPRPGSNPVPSRLGDASPIKHVLYIIKENRTYDQLFGDLEKDGKPYGNGDLRLTLFGEDVAPNHRALARDFVLLDNLYASGEVSVDGHHWSNGAYVPDFMQRTWPQQYSDKGTPRLTTSLAATPTGRIWDHVRRAGLTYRSYYYHTTDHVNAAWAKARNDGVRDYEAVDIFLREFAEMERSGTVPSFMIMALSEDHTRGTRPGAHTPKAMVASNDLGIGKIVETISHSSLWKEFAIFIIEDDAQNGPDHVDAHRTVGLVVSPYTRGTGLDSTPYTTTSFLRTMELILGTTPMSQFDAAATPMYRSFHMSADLAPYSTRTPATDLDAINPPQTEPSLLASIDYSEPDQLSLAQEIALNKAIWHSIKGAEPYPGSVRRFGFRSVEDEDDEER